MHPTTESDSAACIIPLPRSRTPRCAAHHRVKIRCVHHTAESIDEKFSKNSVVCIPPRSQTPGRASHRGVNNLSSVCFNPKFYEYYSSVMPRDINRVGILSFKKNVPIFAFFSVLYKRTDRSLRSFLFFIKERNDLCVLFRSL